MTDMYEFPVKGRDANPLSGSLSYIPLYDQLEFDTHDTFQEHALKESSSWAEFSRNLEAAEGKALTEEDPFSYYLQQGPGRFYRAYLVPGDPMVAGMTIRPNEQNGYGIDQTYSISQKGVAAAAYHRMLTRKFFNEFAGMPPLNRTTNLTVPTDTLTGDHALARAIMDYGLVMDDNLVVPMPGIAPYCKSDMTDEEIDTVRTLFEENKMTGVFEHNWMGQNQHGRERQEIQTEYYRRGQYVGALTIPIAAKSASEIELSDAEGGTINYFNMGYSDTAQHVRVLRTLARHDGEIAKLILS